MIEKTTLLRARRFDIEEVRHPLENGAIHRSQIVRHPGAVVVLPLIDDDHVCLIRNYRVAVDLTLLELPAGTCEPPEPVHTLAYRELVEETGYRAGKLEHVHTFVMSPGILDEKMHFFVASELTEGNPDRETGEQIENQIFTWSEIDGLLRDGAILDAKTLVGLLWYMRYRTYA